MSVKDTHWSVMMMCLTLTEKEIWKIKPIKIVISKVQQIYGNHEEKETSVTYFGLNGGNDRVN